jgi:hypothetical protein
VASHSGLAEVAGALESHVGRPGLFSFQPGSGSVGRIAEGIDRLLMLEPSDRASLQEAVREFVTRQWSWRRTAEGLIDAAVARSRSELPSAASREEGNAPDRVERDRGDEPRLRAKQDLLFDDRYDESDDDAQ